jgi:hypothetical protein
MLSLLLLNVENNAFMPSVYDECRYAECRGATKTIPHVHLNFIKVSKAAQNKKLRIQREMMKLN